MESEYQATFANVSAMIMGSAVWLTADRPGDAIKSIGCTRSSLRAADLPNGSGFAWMPARPVGSNQFVLLAVARLSGYCRVVERRDGRCWQPRLIFLLCNTSYGTRRD